MAITNYSELQTACANWLIRGDLTARIPEFIALAEARINRVLRERHAELDVSLTGTGGSRTIALPATYSEALACWIILPNSTQRLALRFVDPAKLDVYTIPGQPYAWTIDGDNLAFERPLDQAYSFVLRAIEKYQLSDANPTNALLSNHPDAYLYTTLAEAAPFLRDADLASAYETKARMALGAINWKDGRSRAPQTLSTEIGQLGRLARDRSAAYNIYQDR